MLTWFVKLWCFQLSINGNKTVNIFQIWWSIFCLKRTLGNSSDFHLLIITWFASVPKASALWGSCQAVEHGPLLVSWLPRDPAVHWFGSSFFSSSSFLQHSFSGGAAGLVFGCETIPSIRFPLWNGPHLFWFSFWSLSHLDASSIRR